jgi:anti-anti-sigma factor
MSARQADPVSLTQMTAPVATGTVEVTVSDRLDSRTVPAVGMYLDRVLALQPRHLIVDLADCPYLDAAAIGLLLDVHRRLMRVEALLILRAPTPRLQQILRVARVDRVLHIVTDAAADGPADSSVPRTARPA